MKDWDWYSGKDLEINRQKPIKPQLDHKKNGVTAADARKYADALERYEKEFSEYQNIYKEYRDQLSERYSAFRTDLFDEAKSEWIKPPVFDIIYDRSYDCSHAHGFEEVYNEFWEQVDFIERIMQAMR